jgi:hypothetical protein
MSGSGFAAGREYVVSIDGVYFGHNTTNASGGFHTGLRPGGLGAGVAQSIEHVEATDGTVTARTAFTLTRPTGARFLATSGNPNTLRAQFQVWGFGLDGRQRPVYIHYVAPSGAVRRSVLIGNARGRCGYALTPARRVFPFKPTRGRWTLQLDSNPAYSSTPGGPVARIGVRIS